MWSNNKSNLQQLIQILLYTCTRVILLFCKLIENRIGNTIIICISRFFDAAYSCSESQIDHYGIRSEIKSLTGSTCMCAILNNNYDN